jgi:hypothetical protein
MKDIIEKVESYRNSARKDAIAHLVSAEAHRSKDMRLGAVGIILSTLVSTAVFTGLAKRFSISDGVEGWGVVLAFVISAIVVAAPILTTVHKYMHDEADANSHNASAVRYDLLIRKYDLFLLEYSTADDSKRDQAIKMLHDLDAQYAAAREHNITLTDKALRRAKLLLDTCSRSALPGKQ